MDTFPPPKSTPPLLLLVLLLTFTSSASSVSFNYSNIDPTLTNCRDGTGGGICPRADAVVSTGVIQLTRNQLGVTINNSIGRAYYPDPVALYDPQTRQLTDFITHFSFIINAFNSSNYGDGIAFFLVPFNTSSVPAKSSGGCLGLFSDCGTLTKTVHDPVVAVEFDSYQNDWDPNAIEAATDHVGINVNTIKSVETVVWKSGIKKGKTANAWVSYNSASHNLSVFLTYADDPVFGGNSSLSYVVDLREVLPSQVAIGFSASTGSSVEIHSILSWDFNSTLDVPKVQEKGFKLGVVVGASIASAVVLVFVLLLAYIWYRKKKKERRDVEEYVDADYDYDSSLDDEFEKGRGPQKFPYAELAKATNNFSPEGRLGEGGFGAVYKGYLKNENIEVAIKRVSKGSRQGKKEFMAEVNIISRLRHRNLVQLIGWCHERGELLLIYEYMSNASLDLHLFNPNKPPIPWPVRYKIAQGLASGLLYLHEEWEQCVVHRDVKSSNVMLDSNFTAKLGDFGLARLVDHERTAQTTALAGTLGYMAPECVLTGRASKESDVYSFGVVVLEIVCGRKPVDHREVEGRVGLLEMVWGLYGKGSLIEAADKRILDEDDVNTEQVERLLEVGLWCAHPDVQQRPSMRQAIGAFDMGSNAPSLPSEMPKPVYFSASGGLFSTTTVVASSQTRTTNSSNENTLQTDNSFPR